MDLVFSLDKKLGGGGRYVWEAWGQENILDQLADAKDGLNIFRTFARDNGIDPEAFIDSLGGQPSFDDCAGTSNQYGWYRAKPTTENFQIQKQHQLNDTKESKMANLNRVLLIGNCTRDPDQRFTPKGTAVTEIGLAINRVFKGENDEKKEEVTFVDVTLWGRQAEVAAQYLKKGKPVFIEGRLQLDSWDDKQTGQKRSRLRVVAESIQLLGSRQEGESSSPTPSPALAEQRARQTAPAPQGRTSQPDPDLDAEPDDIPF